MLGQEGEDLTRGLEDEAHDQADQPGQEGAQLLANGLEPLAYSLCAGFETVQPSKGKGAENNADS